MVRTAPELPNGDVMSAKLVLSTLAMALAACSTVGQLTVKDYKAKSGERIVAGQAEPKDEYRCEKLSQEAQPWGLAGNMNRAGSTEKVTAVAVDSAPGKGANYVYVMTPSESRVGGFNVNA